MGKNTIIFLLISFWMGICFGQTLPSSADEPLAKHQMMWGNLVSEKLDGGSTGITYLQLKNGGINEENLPVYSIKKKLKSIHSELTFIFKNISYADFSTKEIEWLKTNATNISSTPKASYEIAVIQKLPYAYISLVPIVITEMGEYKKIISFDIEIVQSEKSNKMKSPAGKVYAPNSVLTSNDWYKVAHVEDGVYKITYEDMVQAGIINSTVSSSSLRMFAGTPFMLPKENDTYKTDDLKEVAVKVFDNNDGTFGSGDYFIYYGRGAHRWKYGFGTFTHETNLYADTNYYFLSVFGNGKRISSSFEGSSATYSVTEFDDFVYHEKDNVNLIKSGSQWYGELFGVLNEQVFGFNIPGISKTETSNVNYAMVVKTDGAISNFGIKLNSANLGTVEFPSTTSDYTSPFGTRKTGTFSFVANSDQLNVILNFNPGVSSAKGWLDYLEIVGRRSLSFSASQMNFRDSRAIGKGTAEYFLSGVNSNLSIWDISDIHNPAEIVYQLSGSTASFKAKTDSLKEFVALNGTFYKSPFIKGKIPNQDLHSKATSFPDYIIICPPKFLDEAEELAELHRTEDLLSVLVVPLPTIYNEFSSGKQDITAIKDFVKMFYDQAPDTTMIPHYLLLFGDGSYDLKNRVSGNSNVIPSYQSQNSLTPTQSYISDDYFGLLDDSEGENLIGVVDIGIGRIPVKSKTEAKEMVAKIKYYYKSKSLKDWRNWVAFVGDDEDGNIHMSQANGLAEIVEQQHPEFNTDKILIDAFQQVSSSGGQRYPTVNEAINKRMDQGALILSYVGHGGELGWSQERILEVSQINSWKNKNNMPLFLTATCEFSRYDDPQRTSAGEYVLLNPEGGGIGLLTTTRLVYSAPNYELSQAFFNNAFDKINGNLPRLGDLCRITKASNKNTAVQTLINYRNFSLLGDPAITLAYPKYQVVSTSTQVPDTMQALDKVTVSGFIADDSGSKLSTFNGLIYPTVFDKSLKMTTLSNDGNQNPFQFEMQKNGLFKGKATVVNGEFSFSFVVPKDIKFEYGKGKVSYYAENGEEDANGYFSDFLVGGFNPNAAEDNISPDMELYLNDKSFVFGGVTDENPDLFAILFDENGINTVGNGIGHDIVAVLDKNTSEAIVLNEYYESETDSYQNGKINYPFYNLSEGQHSLSLKVWDVYNNSAEDYVEFVVAKNAELAVEHLLNYPNPFTTRTSFHFDHNQPGQVLDVRIQIFTVSGKLIKTIDTYTNGNVHVGPIDWDGRDDFGDLIGKGVYIYRVKVNSPNGNSIDKFEKLVILK